MSGALVDPALVDEAMAALGVTRRRDLRPGGQKAVVEVDRNGEVLVMKVIAIRSSAPDTLKRAEREVQALAGMSSPHVVRVASDLVELGGDPALGAAWLEEYLDGDDLTPGLGSEWSWADTAKLGIDIGRGLGAGHERGVVHRDLSSNNVRQLGNGDFKVMDFGFARHTLLSGITVAGQPGTLGFLSPEHLHAYSGAPTAASDVFCVGILMYTALTGFLPIPHSGDDADYVRRLSNASVPSLETLRPDLSDEQRAFVMRCLHRQPARRFLNGTRLADALEAVAL
jgi:serine/threonine-protein kinase